MELAVAALTRSCSSACWLMLPAQTLSPGALSTGTLSPVMGAWFTLLWPAMTSPSSGMRAPGATRTRAPVGTSAVGTVRLWPLGCSTSVVSGARRSRLRMARRARSMARSSMRSAAAYKAMTMAASGHWPIRKAPVTATAISAWMPNCRRARLCRPALYTPRPDRAMATTARAMPAYSSAGYCGVNQCEISASSARPSAAPMRGQPGSTPWSWPWSCSLSSWS